MTYLIITAIFLLFSLLLSLSGYRRSQRKAKVAALGLTLAAMWLLTAIFDNVMIAADLFSYPEQLISGLLIGAAPIEDFAYPLAAVLILPNAWHFFNNRPKQKLPQAEARKLSAPKTNLES